MQDDLAALKKGQPPTGFKIEKESEREIKPVPQVVSPKITPPPPPISHVELGKLEKSKPMVEAQDDRRVQRSAMPVPPQFGLSEPSIGVPSTGGIFGSFKSRPALRKVILYGIVGLVGFIITAYLIPYFAFSPSESVSPTPSATPTRTSTATPVSIESLFSTVDTVSISLGQDFTTRFIDSVKTDPLMSSREPGIYRIVSVDGAKRYDFTEFFGGVSVAIPDELKPLIDEGNLWLTLTYKSDNTISFGFIAKLTNPNTTDAAEIAMQNWENSVVQILTDLFQLDPGMAASLGFLSNTYNGTAIKYKNFSDPSSTIDYTVIQAKNGESYLVMVNSREHIYKIIDVLK
ncbi:MAG: hypothetical protein HYT65_02360 [Candidatus Yanofskybacteria bacterium]|nr:hypothetical protein [Candidatus Yanofskybacteria bacterium]